MKSSNGAFTPSLVLSVVLLLIILGVITQLKDPAPRQVVEAGALKTP
jgi:hypothetical protein